MSEWVDFGLYSLQAVLLWMVLPAWGAHFLQPLRSDGSRASPRTGGWIPALRAWGILSVLVLLAYRMDIVPPPLSSHALRTSGWETLLMTSNLMLALGLLFAGYGVMRFMRWLKANAAAQESRSVAAFPPTRDDFLPGGLQRLAYALVLVALLARPVAGLVLPGQVQDVWGNFVAGLVLAALLFAAASGSVMRAPNALDRQLGHRWRQTEVRLCYLLMGNLALLELAGLALELSGEHSRRAVALVVAGFVSLTLGSLMLMPSRPRVNAAPEEDVLQ